MARKTVEQVLIEYCKNYKQISTVEIETVLPKYGRLIFDVLHTPGTYSRAFRHLREKGELKRYGIDLVDVSESSGKVKKWQINYM